MILQVRDITGALNKISDMVKGDKTIPGIMLRINEDSVDVCYNDGHKALIEKINAVVDSTDFKGKIVLPYEQFVRAIGNCQPSGIIKVKDIELKFSDNNIVKIKAERFVETGDSEGDEKVMSKVGTKVMDVQYIDVENTQDQKAKILNRMNYESIFDVDGEPDEWNKDALSNIFTKVSVEMGRQVYMSEKIQKIYVVNTAFTSAVPAPTKEVTQEDLDELRGTLSELGELEQFNEKALKLGNTMRKACCISTNMASMASSIINKMNAEENKVYLHIKDGYVAIFNSDNTTGIYFEQSKPSKMQVGAFERFAGFNYSRYHINVLREVLVDSVKSAVNTTKNDKTSLTFKKAEDGKYSLVIVAQNSGSSVSDTYDVALDSVKSVNNDVDSVIITIALKPFAEMLSQLKSDFIAIDISEETNGQVCMRLAEINTDKLAGEWTKARTSLGLPLEPVLDQPMPETPLDVVMGYRANTLDTCEYSLVTVSNK